MRTNPFRPIYDSPEYREAWQRPLIDFPMILDIETTNRCNLNCVQCPHQKMTREQGDMPPFMYTEIVTEAAKRGCKGVRFILFGEPLLHPRLFKMITFAHRKGLLTHLTTNGVLLHRWNVDAILKSGLDSLVISMQGIDKAGYEQLRGPHYDEVIHNLKYIANFDNRPFITLTTTVLDEQEPDISVFKGYWAAWADKVDVWETHLGAVKGLERVQPFLSRERKHPPASHPCNDVFNKMNLLWNGDAIICCDICQMDTPHILGHFPTESLYDIWHGNRLNRIREAIVKWNAYPISCTNCSNKF